MVREIKDGNLLSRVKAFARTPFFVPVLFLLFLVITLPVITLVTSHRTGTRQNAAAQGQTATINIAPVSGTVTPGQQFTADLVIDGGGQLFNAAQADVTTSGNVTVQSVNIVPVDMGGCNMTFATQALTPSSSNLSFAGAILNGSSTKCILYTVTLTAGSSGSGGIAIANGQVKAYQDSSEIFLSSQNGLFTISSTNTTPIAQSVMYLSPAQSNVQAGQTFPVQIRINTNGQTTNAVESYLSYPTSLLSVVSIDHTGAAFSDITATESAGSGTVHVAYGTFGAKSGDLLVTTVNFKALATGTAHVDIGSGSSIVSNTSFTNIMKDSANAVYTIAGSVTPTVTVVPSSSPTPTTVPTNSPTPTRTPTPTPTTGQGTPTATPTTVPTPTNTPVPPTATTIPSPTATPPVAITLSVNTVPGKTYATSYNLSGSKSTSAVSVFVNNTTTGVSYPTSTTWQDPVNLAMGDNAFAIFAQDAIGNKSSTATVIINRHKLGDITGDNLIDLQDVSIFGSDWGKSANLNDPLSDMNGDGIVNLTDFSILAKAYGN